MTATTATTDRDEAVLVDDAEPADLAPFATRPVLLIAGVTAVVMLALATRYGYHRDELYYLIGGERLDWGYVDHPPLTPLVAHVVDVVSGGSLLGLRAVGALITFLGIVAGAQMARELGGRRTAQVLAAFAIAASPILRAPNALVGTTGFDQLAWIAVLLLVLRLLRTGTQWLWLPIGIAVGVGLETKATILVLVVGLGVGILVARRELVRTPWLLAGIVAALAIWAPNVWWNAQHDWAMVDFQLGLRGRQSGLDKRAEYLAGQFLLTGITTVGIWWAGGRWLCRREGPARAFRPVGIAAVVIVVGLFVVGGKMYYSGPIYLPLLAAGAVVLEAAPRPRRRRAIGLVLAALVFAAPATVPLLPAGSLGLVKPLNKEFGEMVGWPELAEQVTAAVGALPADERARTVVLTANYGEAGALERFAPELRTYSGQNSYWYWGPPPDTATTAVLVGFRATAAAELCGTVQQVATIANDAHLDNDEDGRPILLCRNVRQTWAEAWPELRHVD